MIINAAEITMTNVEKTLHEGKEQSGILFLYSDSKIIMDADWCTEVKTRQTMGTTMMINSTQLLNSKSASAATNLRPGESLGMTRGDILMRIPNVKERN